MKIYNSKSNTIETFVPINKDEVTLYLCGPTVYNYAHIGNARPLVVFDMMRRVLKELGFKVKFVSNYTDVDDRIVNKALEEQVPINDITERYIKAYELLKKDLNITGVNNTPKATEAIDKIISFIEALIASGYAYEVNGDVYFRIDKIDDYGEISGQSLEDLMTGARIEKNEDKENPLDFVLWKKTELGKKWDSPWSKGRPGWHSECVVMIHDSFNTNKIDIHAGGIDLKFPHHENESAQNRALHHEELANYWVHNAMINIDGTKMSKSLGNVILAQDFVNKLGGNVTRWLLLSTHYRLNIDITDALVEQSQKEMKRIENTLRQASVYLQIENIDSLERDIQSYNKFMDAMKDDLNVANGQAVIFSTIKTLNQLLRNKEKDNNEISRYTNSLKQMLEVLGIKFNLPLLTDMDKETYHKWKEATAVKEFDKADEYRAILIERGML